MDLLGAAPRTPSDSVTTFVEISPNTYLPSADWSETMPRKSATADTLMDQAQVDSDLVTTFSQPARLGDLDDTGNERLPDFTTDDITPEPTHEERLASLDARDERLNGNVAVRPSEQCGIVAGGGMYPGRRCTYAEHPMNQPHSWEVSTDPPSDAPGHVYDDAEQPTLPGTPEPEFSEYSVPVESAFNDHDFMSAPGLHAIADAWISETEELAHLRGVNIRYFWKRRGGLKGGNERLGNLSKPSGITKYSLGHPTLWMWLAADHCRDLKLDHEQIRAAVLHELCKAATDPDDHSAFRVVGPDAEVFALEIQLCGLWSLDLREMGANVKQLGLLDGLALPDATDQSDAPDEGEASDEYILASLEASEGEADDV